jgi:hypothetical protein
MEKRTITQHINQDLSELTKDPSPQRKRFLEDEVEQLEKYKDNHPNDDHDPSSLELFCNENPHELECKIFDV